MSKTTASILIFIVSLAVGIAASELFYRFIFVPTVPPALLTSVSVGTSRFQFLMGGVGLGVIIFTWTLVAVGITVAAQKVSKHQAVKAATAGSAPPKA